MRLMRLSSIVCLSALCLGFVSCNDDETDTLNKFVLSQSAISMVPGQEVTLEYAFYPDNISDKTVEWTSSDEAVASVEEGVVTALTTGTVVITATPTAAPSLAQSCYITVTESQLSVSGSVEGVWEAGTTVIVTGQLKVEEGKSLTIEEGVEVIFNSADEYGAGIEFMVDGNIYCRGTEEEPILFTVNEAGRSWTNVTNCSGLWGGFMLNNEADDAEALFEYCVIEYTGSPMIETSPSVKAGIYTSGEDNGVQITTSTKFKGNLVVEHCTIRNGYADGIYMEGGNAIITNNLFYCNGVTGGEAVNVKAGTYTIVAYNVMYSPNTNGLKLSSSGQDDTGGRGQSKCLAYNNTIVNAGWRRDGDKGGCIYVEKNILANVFNNLMVNCKYRAQTPSWGDPGIKKGCDVNTVVDYNCYMSGSVTSDFSQDQVEGAVKTAYEGYNTSNENYYPEVDMHSIVSTAPDDVAISFVNFPYDTNKLSNTSYDSTWDFHTTSMVEGATADTSLATMDGVSNSLMVDGNTYTAPAPQPLFGAHGE